MPNKSRTMVSFEDVLSDLLKWLEDVPFVIIGGVAASLLGRPRHTQDIDALVMLENEKWEELVCSMKKFNFIPRINDLLEFARKNRVLLIKHVKSGIDIDISFGALPFEEECISRLKMASFGKLKLPIPTSEDFVIMKAVAHRPRDMDDIRTIAEVCSHLDKKRIKKWVSEFARVLEMPEIWNDVDKIINKKKSIQGYLPPPQLS